MSRYEFSIAVKDEPEAGRKKEGDIVGVHPERPSCGRKLMDGYLLIPFECNLSFDDLRMKIKLPLHEGGLKRGIDFRLIDDEDRVDEKLYPAKLYVWNMKTEVPILRPKQLAKTRYRIPFSLLGILDFNKVRDKEIIYQPFKKVSGLISRFQANSNYEVSFDAIESNQKIVKIADTASTATPKNVAFRVHGSAPGLGDEDEKVFKWDALNNLVQDKFDSVYILPKDL